MQIDFERHFRKRSRSYDTAVGKWWIEKSTDRAHQIAYKNIVRRMQDHCSKKPRVIIDYACGNGMALPLLREAFPTAELIGLDGSRRMLKIAAGKTKDVRLIRTALPNFKLRLPKADIVLFSFPNMNFTVRGAPRIPARIKKVARLLGTLEDRGDVSGRHLRQHLLRLRDVAENIRGLMRKDALWFKAEYSGVSREKMTQVTQWRLLFTEAAFAGQIDGKDFFDRFGYRGSEFFRSRVVLDVYDQTLNRADRNGGYSLSVFHAR